MKSAKYIFILFATASLGLASCGNRNATKAGTHVHDDGSAHDEHAHEENLQLTGYSPDFEVYAEATPFVVGQPSDILSHFSFLKNFKPITEGSITASLVVGTDGIRQTLTEPTRPGIFLFSLTPVVAGEARLVFDITTGEEASQIVVRGITVYSNAHDAWHAAEEAVAISASGALFTKEQSWKVDFATEEARTEPFGEIIKTTGQIQPSQGDERVVVAKASGIVTFPGSEIVEGEAVSAGQILFTIDGNGMAEKSITVVYAEAESEYNRARIEYERKTELAKDNIVSQSDLLTARTAFINAEAVYDNLRGNFSAGRQSVSSPIGGYITRVSARSGQYVEAGQSVVTVSQNRDLFIKAELQSRYFDKLSGITSANFRPMTGESTYTLEELDGSVVSYGKSTDIANPLIPVVFRVNNSANLLPGSFVEMYITTLSDDEAVTVPLGAIVEEMGRYFVYVQLTPEFFEKRPVRTGATDGFRIRILEGVTAGERVVSKGAILVKLSQASGALDAHSGHVH